MSGPVETTRPRSPLRAALAASLALLVCAGLVALGNWQVARRAWKWDLIERVDARVHASPMPAPGPQAWSQVDAAHDEYRHVRIAGVFLPGAETLVQANTVLGPGFWVIAPLRTGSGFVVLVNRGFLPGPLSEVATRPRTEPRGVVEVTGLLRLTEPHGAFLRANNPAGGRWYSRDVAAIAAAHEIPVAAPYFIDADAATTPPGAPPSGAPPSGPADPVGGLTVIAFPNDHLVYAITWYGLALMLLAAASYMGWTAWQERQPHAAGQDTAGQDPAGQGDRGEWRQRMRSH